MAVPQPIYSLPAARVTSGPAQLSGPAELTGLAAEFPGYDFGTQQTWDGVAIVARRHEGGAQPGLYAVVTSDLDEMRRALREQEATQLTV